MSENSLHALLIGLAILFSPFLFIQVFRWLQLSRARSNKHVTIKRTTKIGLLVSGLIQNRLKVLSKYPVGAPIYISFGKIIRYGFSSQEKGFRYLTAELSLWKFLWILFIPISLGGPERQMKDYLEWIFFTGKGLSLFDRRALTLEVSLDIVHSNFLGRSRETNEGLS